MRLRVLLALVGVGVLVMGVSSAVAHDKRFSTNFILMALPPSDDFRLKGFVQSEKPKCESDRTVKLFTLEGSDKELLDTDRTNDKGKFVVRDPDGDNHPYLLKITKEKLGGPGHKHVCKPASGVFEET